MLVDVNSLTRSGQFGACSQNALQAFNVSYETWFGRAKDSLGIASRVLCFFAGNHQPDPTCKTLFPKAFCDKWWSSTTVGLSKSPCVLGFCPNSLDLKPSSFLTVTIGVSTSMVDFDNLPCKALLATSMLRANTKTNVPHVPFDKSVAMPNKTSKSCRASNTTTSLHEWNVFSCLLRLLKTCTHGLVL